MGALTSLLVLIQLFTLPNKNTDEEDTGTNFSQILGFFNMMVFIQLISAFGSGGNTVELLKELIILSFISLFMINNLSGRVTFIKDYEQIQKVKFKFQDKIVIFSKIKEKLGDKSLIFMALGLALGYPIFVIDSYLGSPILFLEPITSQGVASATIYHRIYLFFALSLILLSTFLYGTSKTFKEFVKNRYTFKDTLQLFKGLFLKGENGEPSIVQQEIKASTDKLKGAFMNAKSSFLGGFLGKKPPKGTNDQDSTEKQLE
jgi:hypothetical protein